MTSPISFVLHFSGIALETGLLAAVKPFLDWTVDSKCITKNEYIYKGRGFCPFLQLAPSTQATRLVFPDRRLEDLPSSLQSRIPD